MPNPNDSRTIQPDASSVAGGGTGAGNAPTSVLWQDAAYMTDAELIALAVASNPGLTYGRVSDGLNIFLQLTRCISLWRNEECFLAGDQPRGTLDGYPAFQGGGV